ncbi:Brefeldin a-inhibited guanine nucleotide-exchange protein 1, partial [Globisporangium splendens]
MLPTSIMLNAVHTSVVNTRKEDGHTDYAIRVQTDAYDEGEIVYRRFSAFLQLQRLACRHFQDTTYCCGGDKNCLLATFLEPVFTATEFPVMQGRFLGKNSKNVVRERVLFLNAFLLELEEALNKCPPVVMNRCEKENCKLTKLIKSFYGCVEMNRPSHSRSLASRRGSMELVTKVKDAEHWGQLREASDKKLLVVDVHKDWCGPCKIMEPTYKRLSVDIDQVEKRVAFATLEQLVKQHCPPLGNDDEETQ